jgi:hypothetical protein
MTKFDDTRWHCTVSPWPPPPKLAWPLWAPPPRPRPPPRQRSPRLGRAPLAAWSRPPGCLGNAGKLVKPKMSKHVETCSFINVSVLVVIVIYHDLSV